MSKPGTFGLVLAGGKSRRMGHDKALLERGSQSQLSYVAGLLDSHVDEVFISTREDQCREPERRRFKQIIDRYDDMGPLAGMLSAMDAFPKVDWLIVACDLPNVSDTTLEHLLASVSAEHPFTAFASSYDGLPEPLCAVYRAGSDAILRQFADDGIRCPRKILDPRSLDNINTPDDLADSVLEEAS
jgi:molybdopterin-guanine dinucleotide biosynthesis protein A